MLVPLLILQGCDCGNNQNQSSPSDADKTTALNLPDADNQPVTRSNGSLSVTLDRGAYLRYMIVNFDVKYGGNSAGAIISAHVEKDGKLLSAVGDAQKIDLLPQSAPGTWHGAWAMNWNPPLGACEMVVEVSNPGEQVISVRVPFTLKKLDLPPTPKGMAVVTLESDSEFKTQNIEGPEGKNVDWKGLISWAHYMGASDFLYSVGITKARWNPTSEQPWKQYNLDFALDLGREAHAQGLRFGGWAGAFLAYGTTMVTTCGYTPSRNLTDSGVMVSTLHFSLGDPKRRKDLTEICRWMQQHEEFDWIGFDYIRSGFGGYEMVDTFVQDLAIPTPEGWNTRSLDNKIKWLLGELRGKRDPIMLARWQWWRASYVARFVAEVRKEAVITKPFFVFSLGWEMGHQHGQDVLMFNDAGAYDFVMLYEATRDEFDYMMKSWPLYLGKDQGTILAGNCVDYNLLENRWAPYRQPPDEYYLRSAQAQSGMKSSNGLVDGVFWHDLERALYLRRGPNWMPSDYAVSGAASFTAYRNAQGVLPIKLELAPAGTSDGRYLLSVKVSNTGSTPVEDLVVKLARTNGVAGYQDSQISLGTLAPGQSQSVNLSYYAKTIIGEKLIPRWKQKLDVAAAEKAMTPEQRKAKLQEEKDKLRGKKKKTEEAKKTDGEKKVKKAPADRTGLAMALPYMVAVQVTWKGQYPLDRAFAYIYPAQYKSKSEK